MRDIALPARQEVVSTRFNRGSKFVELLSRAGLGLAILAVVAYGSLTSPAFLTAENIVNILTSMAIVGIVVVGMTFVLAAGGLADLSVPATIACGAILSLALQPIIGPIPAFVLAIALAGACGLVNGLLVGYVGVNPIIATLAIGSIVLGIVQAAVGGVIVYGSDPASGALVKGRVFGIPMVVLVFLVVAIIGNFVLSRTFWGRWTVATGGNTKAAQASAVPVRAVKAGAFVITRLGFGAKRRLARIDLAERQAGCRDRVRIQLHHRRRGWRRLDHGRVWVGAPAIAGLILVQLLTNVMVLEGVRTPIQGFVLGLLIAAAVALDVALRKRGVA